MSNEAALLWVDLETPGLDPTDPWAAILEASFVTTDRFGEVLGAVSIIPKYPSNFLDYMVQNMDQYCKDMHMKSGLLEALREKQTEAVWDLELGTNKAASIEDWMMSLKMIAMCEALGWITQGIRRVCEIDPHNHKLTMAGATVHFDRQWLKSFWPSIEDGFHYRNFDISTLRKFVALLKPDLADQEPKKREGHRAYADIEDAIKYYLWTQDHLFL